MQEFLNLILRQQNIVACKCVGVCVCVHMWLGIVSIWIEMVLNVLFWMFTAWDVLEHQYGLGGNLFSFLTLSVVFFVTAWMCVRKLPTLYIYFSLLTQCFFFLVFFLSQFVAEFVLENEEWTHSWNGSEEVLALITIPTLFLSRPRL